MSNEEFKEQLSALVDDELRREETGFLLRRLGQTPEAIEQVGRYFMIRDALRGGLPAQGSVDLSDRIAAALETEPTHASRQHAGRRFAKPLAGLAVAASVAALSLNFWSTTPQAPATAGAAKLADATSGVLTPVAADSASEQWERLDPAMQRRLNSYLVNHSEHTSNGPMGGVLNYVRITGQQDAD